MEINTNASVSASVSASTDTLAIATGIISGNKPHVSLVLSNTGINRILFGNIEVASGSLVAETPPYLKQPDESSFDAILTASYTGGQVQHTYAAGTVNYAFNKVGDNEISIKATVWNNTDKPISFINFKGLTFPFTSEVKGYGRAWHYTYIQAHKPDNIFHPSVNTQLGCSWIYSKDLGVGFNPQSHLTDLKLINAEWNKDEAIPQKWSPNYIVKIGLKPHSATEVMWTIKIDKTSDFKNLCLPYYNYCNKVLPKATYKKENRYGLFSAPCDPEHQTKDNPFGFQWGRRLDTAAGVVDFQNMSLKPIQDSPGASQGIIIWDLLGVVSDRDALGNLLPNRGARYRPDFDVFPNEIAANIPALVAKYKEKGLRVGLATRPGEVAVRHDINIDATQRIHSESNEAMNGLFNRFIKVISLGFNMFYMDTFGANLDDFFILRQLRQLVLQEMPTYSEFCFDILSRYTARYIEVTADSTSDNLKFTFLSKVEFDFINWLTPEMSYFTVNRSTVVTDEDLYKAGLCPAVQDYLLVQKATALQALHKKYVEVQVIQPTA